MKLSIRIYALLIAVWACAGHPVSAQELGKAAPVTLFSGPRTDSVSFVLTTLDDDMFKGKPIRYSSAIEIIDASEPWPPRWFALHPADTGAAPRPSRLLMMNASVDSGHLHYLTVAQVAGERYEPVVITTDAQMRAVDTFAAYRHAMDSHDFTSDGGSEVIYFASHDTTLDLSVAYGSAAETYIPAVYQSIEIADSSGRSVFSWNPFYQLGFSAMYPPYRHTKGMRSDHSRFDWSHGNSVHYDVDGDILYSFKHIGIGKISRKDGHVIWRIDRNKQRMNPQSDSLPIFLQHDLQVVRGTDGRTYYSVWSNGDSAHPSCRGYVFSVRPDTLGQSKVTILMALNPHERIPNTGAGGNMDVNPAGGYLMNYGLFPTDSTVKERPLMEMVSSEGVSVYTVPRSIFAFRAHVIHGQVPARPLITQKGSVLYHDGQSGSCKWYKIKTPEDKAVSLVHKGSRYTPAEEGYYCVAIPYGVGWSVSQVYHYTKK